MGYSSTMIKSDLISECEKSLEFYYDYLIRLKSDKDKINILKDIISNDYYNDLFKLNKFSTLLIIFNLDLAVNIKGLYLAKHNWEKIFYIKNICLTIVEIIKKYDEKENASFLREKSSSSDELKEEFTNLTGQLRDFKKRNNYNKMKQIRDKVSAHIDISEPIYFDLLLTFDAEEIAQVVLEFMNITHKCIDYMKLLMLEENKNFVKIEKNLLNKIKFLEEYVPELSEDFEKIKGLIKSH